MDQSLRRVPKSLKDGRPIRLRRTPLPKGGRGMWDQGLLAEDLGMIKELERKINEKEPDFLIGLHLEDCLPEEADVEGLARIFTNAFSVLPKKAGAHYRSEEHTSELQTQFKLLCRLLL